jgi:uncharacterized protein YbbC (DUF1343 family)
MNDAPVQTGLARLLSGLHRGMLKGQRVGLATHPAAVLPDLTGAADALLAAGVRLTVLFGPEHGLDGAAADGVGVSDARDRRTGLPVRSLYPPPASGGIGLEFAHETREALFRDVDVLLFDVQDVGARFYTYISTLRQLLSAAGQNGHPIIVLDRPNPINGRDIEGPGVDSGYESFVGAANVPVRHGLTMGEMARYMNGELDLGADLTVIEMAGWRRETWYDQTGLPWAPTSPAMPHVSTATVYPGTCLVEGTNLSEGRGTALPFEVIGAPWLDGHALADRLNNAGLSGVRFRATRFTPSASKHVGKACEGVQLHVTEREAFRPVMAGVTLLAACREQAADKFSWRAPEKPGARPHIDLLAGGSGVRQLLDHDCAPEEVTAGWGDVVADFAARRAAYLLYQ